MNLSYTWQGKFFPYLLYHSSSKLRVHVIENITHNFNWLSQYRHLIVEDHVRLSGYFRSNFIKMTESIFSLYKEDIDAIV
jgi:hypothetical protein